MVFRINSFVPFLALSIILALIATGCAAAGPASNYAAEASLLQVQQTEDKTLTAVYISTPVPTPAPTVPPGLDTEQLGNMTYRMDILAQALPDSEGTVTLSEGHFDQPYPDSAVGVVVDLIGYAKGDLNADNAEDAVALLAVNTGGTGVFIHLAAVVQEAEGSKHAATQFLGDRVRVESLTIDAGILQVQMITHAPDDPQCCPNEQATQSYTLQGGMLVTLEQSQVLPLAETAIQTL